VILRRPLAIQQDLGKSGFTRSYGHYRDDQEKANEALPFHGFYLPHRQFYDRQEPSEARRCDGPRRGLLPRQDIHHSVRETSKAILQNLITAESSGREWESLVAKMTIPGGKFTRKKEEAIAALLTHLSSNRQNRSGLGRRLYSVAEGH
jgi:hypothetical protein